MGLSTLFSDLRDFQITAGKLRVSHPITIQLFDLRMCSMNFQDSIKICFTKYADFTGRASRPEFWWFFLFCLLAGLALSMVSQVLSGLFSLATLLPRFAVGARRLHETNRSGWWQLLWFVPVIGWIIIIIFLAQPAQSESQSVE